MIKFSLIIYYSGHQPKSQMPALKFTKPLKLEFEVSSEVNHAIEQAKTNLDKYAKQILVIISWF